MKFGVIVFPGSNCDSDMLYFLRAVMGYETVSLWHKDTDLQGCDALVLPGGFSYGDYLRSGAIARFSPIMEKVAGHAQSGKILIGICNGFQILCESQLLPGALLHNTENRFICENVYLKTLDRNNAFTCEVPENKTLKLPIAHGEGRYFADEQTLSAMEKNNQILFAYCNEQGEVTSTANPNGSVRNIAGICNEQKNVFGMMPHPERAAIAATSNTDGQFLFSGFARILAEK